jgi:hypothetical protein
VTGSDKATNCVDCPPGTYVSTSGSGHVQLCIDCEAGRYAHIPVGASTCQGSSSF